MEQALDQETLAAQERLLKKRESLGLTTNHTQSISSVLSEERVYGVLKSIYDKVPDCEHGEKVGYCAKCREEAQKRGEEKQREYLRQEEENKRAAKEKEKTERLEHPERWLKDYGVPVKYLQASFDTFQGGESVKKACQSFPEKNVVLIGKTGCGKTHLAVSKLREMVVNDTVPKRALFITAPTLLMKIRDSFRDNTSDSEISLVEYYSGVPCMILDDLGADRATDWAIETLYLIIDGRDSNLKPTFITTNLSITEIEQHYGARIASRIAGMSIIKIDLPDYRKKRG